MSAARTCVHCGKRIVLHNYGMGLRWVHQLAEAAFMDGIHTFCHITVAEPAPERTTP